MSFFRKPAKPNLPPHLAEMASDEWKCSIDQPLSFDAISAYDQPDNAPTHFIFSKKTITPADIKEHEAELTRVKQELEQLKTEQNVSNGTSNSNQKFKFNIDRNKLFAEFKLNMLQHDLARLEAGPQGITEMRSYNSETQEMRVIYKTSKI